MTQIGSQRPIKDVLVLLGCLVDSSYKGTKDPTGKPLVLTDQGRDGFLYPFSELLGTLTWLGVDRFPEVCP